ncbi:MAG: ABC transporter permease [Planctomycetota bacterium]|nr:ABC transporter permease [Planctomycetota bacterium]
MSSNPLTTPSSPLRETVIRPRKGWIAIDWSELWDRRELLQSLVYRDVQVRYKQTVLGFAWAILQPVFSMLVFTFIFGRFAKIPSEGAPYALFVYCGLLAWTFFSSAVTAAAQSLVNQQALLTKIYLPRMFVPAAPVGGALVDLGISFGVFALLMAFFQQIPGWGIVLIPVLLLLLLAAALGAGLFLAALTVSYRDFRYVIPFMMQAGMYVSPVIFSAEMIPPEYRYILALNPLMGIIDSFRAAFLNRPFDWLLLAISAASSIGLLVLGMFYFRKTERRFADVA